MKVVVLKNTGNVRKNHVLTPSLAVVVVVVVAVAVVAQVGHVHSPPVIFEPVLDGGVVLLLDLDVPRGLGDAPELDLAVAEPEERLEARP